METTFNLKASELTADFIDGISKVFSKDAMLHITIEYGTLAAAAPAKKRGRKAGVKVAAVSTGKKRGPKPGPRKAATDEVATPKKRGRKPKISTPAE